MNGFAWASTQLKEGHKVRRNEWPHKDYMLLYTYDGEYWYFRYMRHAVEEGCEGWFDNDEDANLSWADVIAEDWVLADDLNPTNEERW